MSRLRRGRSAPSPGARAALPLALVAVLAPQLLGGATGHTELFILGVLCSACLLGVFELRTYTRSLGRVPWIVWGLALAAAWTLIQATPLPCRLFAAGRDSSSWQAEWVRLGATEATTCTISLAPGSTWTAFALACSLTAACACSVALCRAGQRSFLQTAIAVSSVLMASTALAHAALGAERVFGIYAPESAHPRLLMAPLLNENHLAGHMALGFPLTLSLAIRAEEINRRILWAAGSVMVLCVALLSLSRGGVALTLAGGAAYLATMDWFRSRDNHRRESTARWPRILAVATLTVGAALGAMGQFVDELRQGGLNVDKLEMLARLRPLIAAHPWLGVGRRAIEDATTPLLEQAPRMTHAVNWIAQWSVEWGIPVTLLVSALAFRSIPWRRVRSDRSRALLCGVMALGAQNLVDFSLELAGLASVMAIAVGTLVREEEHGKGSLRLPETSLRSASLACALVAAVAVAMCAPWFTRWDRASLEDRLSRSAGSDPSAFAETLDKALSWYPHHPQFVVLATRDAVIRRAVTSRRWLNLAMQVAPGWAAPHQLAAYELELRGRIGQAAIELGIAMRKEPGPAWESTCAFAQRHPSESVMSEIAPPELPESEQLQEALLGCIGALNRDVVTEPLAQTMSATYPKMVAARQFLVQAAERRGDSPLALELSAQMLRDLPRSSASHAMRSRALARAGRASEAMQLIRAAPTTMKRDRAILMALGDAAAHARDRAAIEEASQELLGAFGTTTEARRELLSVTSTWLQMGGFALDAMARAQSAYDLSGDPAMLEMAHQSAVAAGVLPAALQTAGRLCQLGYKVNVFCAPAPLKSP